MQPLSERFQHDSVSTIAHKFQAHHLFHIFQVWCTRIQTQNLISFQWFLLNFGCNFLGLKHDLDRGSEDLWSRRRPARSSSSFAWLHSHVILIEWMAALQALVFLKTPPICPLHGSLPSFTFIYGALGYSCSHGDNCYSSPPIVVCPHSLFFSIVTVLFVAFR